MSDSTMFLPSSVPDLKLLLQNTLKNTSNTYLAMIVLLNFPLVIVACNVLYQLLAPKNPNLPPVVFHWIPYLGSAAAYGNDPVNFLLRCRKKHGEMFTFILFGQRMTVALGPKGNNFVLGGKLSQVSAELAYTHLTTPVFGKGVVYDVPNHVLMEQKKFVKFGLSTENFRAYVPMMEEEIDKFLDTQMEFLIYALNDINEWGRFNARQRMAELTIFTASRTLQGKAVRDGLDASFAKRYEDLDKGFTPLNMLFPNFPREANRKRDKAQQEMSDFFVDIMRKRDSENLEHEHDMLAALAQQSYKDGRLLGEREIAHIMIALLMAGQHTSSAISAWTLLHIADRPDVAEAIYEEQVKHFGIGEGKFRGLTYDELKDLPVLDSVIRETLRVHPPIHSILRKVISDIPVPPTLAAPSKDSSYIVPTGDTLLATPAVSQLDPTYWPDAQKWEPSRWTDPEGVAAQAYKQYNDAEGDRFDYGFGLVSKGTESNYQPFGAGRHRCIGEQFAYVQLSVVIATFVRKMEMKIEKRVPDINYHTMITLPKEPCGILYRRRDFS